MWFRIIIFIVVAVAVIVIGYTIFQMFPPETAPQEQFPQSEENTQTYTVLDKTDLIIVENPESNQLITSPLIVKGQARGLWFFEASFPVKLLDKNGNVIAAVAAQAKSEWTTEDFVPFEAILEFQKPETKEGTLVLEKDNPSGLPEKADELRIPVNFE